MENAQAQRDKKKITQEHSITSSWLWEIPPAALKEAQSLSEVFRLAGKGWDSGNNAVIMINGLTGRIVCVYSSL